MHDATLKQLRSLSAVARQGTLAGAARTLHVSAPAVGQQLRLLERSVGLELVVRTPGGLQVTDAGAAVVDAAHAIEAELATLGQRLDRLAAGSAGHVTLGAVSTAKYFAPHVLAAFWAHHPDIEVTLRIGNRQETIAALEAMEVDLCIMGRPPAQFDLATAEIGRHPHVVLAAPDHPLVGAVGVRPERLAAETFLIREQGSGTRTLTEAMFASLGQPPRIGMEISSNETIKQAVMAGLGLALLSADTVSAEITDGRLVVLDVVGTPVWRNWFVIRHRHASPSPATTALWDFVVDRCAEFLPGLEVVS